MSAAAIIATHLNVPYGQIVNEADVVYSLKSGQFSALNKEANDILAALFIEIEPRLIFRCMKEIDASRDSAKMLYENSLTITGIRCKEWEKAFSETL